MNNSVKNVGRATVLVLCLLSGHALYNFIYMLYIHVTLRVIKDFQYSNFQTGIIP